MNEYEKEMLRAQFFSAYFRNIKGNVGIFLCIFCGRLSHQDPGRTFKTYAPNSEAPDGPMITNLLPRSHSDDCPVAAKIKELGL